MYEEAQKREYDKFKSLGLLLGVKLEEGDGRSSPTSVPKGNLQFGDPREYEKMSKEERVEQTEKMMGHWKKWAKSSSLEAGDLSKRRKKEND